MKTKVVKIENIEDAKEALAHAGQLIREGALVAFPTETVYGLGADALNAEASTRIYAAKGRPSDNPLIVHIADVESLPVIAADIPAAAYALADAFWPGPLTMIFNKTARVPEQTTGGMDTVAVRMPSDKIAQALIRAGGGFIAAPSANTSGRPSPTTAAHVLEDLDGRIPLILDGGAVQIGLESTIVDLSTGTPTILRPGYITRAMLHDVIGTVEIDPGLIAADSGIKPKAPGMKYRHYAPRAQMTIVEGTQQQVTETINRLAFEQEAAGRRVGILATTENADQYLCGMVRCIGSRGNEDEIAAGLYRVLREFDDLKADVIYSESFASENEADRLCGAIMNRLLKAAGHHVLHAE